ncbi:MAG: hypothetical protein ACI35P_01605, partial [Bacillus sp. (in: firmicutes)]
EFSAFGVLYDVVQSPAFQKAVGGSRFQLDNRIYVYGWSALGATIHKGNCSVLLMVDAFSSIRGYRVAVTVELQRQVPMNWTSGNVIEHFQTFSSTLYQGSLEILVDGYRVLFGAGNDVRVIDYSVKELMVNRLLDDEERFELIEDRILYEYAALQQYLKKAWDTETVGGYQVYRFKLSTGKYLGVTAGIAWIGTSGKPFKNMNVIYDLSKMTMAEARKKVEQSYQHKYIQEMLLWFIHFADMRKKMPTKCNGYSLLTAQM